MSIFVDCVECNKSFVIEAYSSDIKKWKDGELVQKAFWYLSPEERELLISGICGSCFDKMFEVWE